MKSRRKRSLRSKSKKKSKRKSRRKSRKSARKSKRRSRRKSKKKLGRPLGRRKRAKRERRSREELEIHRASIKKHRRSKSRRSRRKSKSKSNKKRYRKSRSKSARKITKSKFTQDKRDAKNNMISKLKSVLKGKKVIKLNFNGSGDYYVSVTGKKAIIYTETKTKPIKSYSFSSKKIVKSKGRTYGLLLTLSKNRYAYIARNIFEFSTESPISKVSCKQGNSDVPYTYALTKDYVYMLSENGKKVNKDEFKNKSKGQDYYDYFYSKLNKKAKKPLRYKLVHKG